MLVGGRRGLGYRNRQLLRIAARAVFRLNCEFGGSLRGGRAADLAGSFVQRQALRRLPPLMLHVMGVVPVALRVCVRLAYLAARQGVRGDGGGARIFADGEVVLRLAAVVPVPYRVTLELFAVKARVARCEGVGMDVVGIDGGVVMFSVSCFVSFSPSDGKAPSASFRCRLRRSPSALECQSPCS